MENENATIEFTVLLEKKDFINFAFFSSYHKEKWSTRMLLLCVSSACLILIGVIFLFTANSDISIAIVIISIAIWLPIQFYYSAVNSYKKSNWAKDKIHFTISNKQISIIANSFSSTFNREHPTRINERKGVFYFWLNSTSIVPAPMRFLSENQIEFIRLLKLNKPNNQYADKETIPPPIPQANYIDSIRFDKRKKTTNENATIEFTIKLEKKDFINFAFFSSYNRGKHPLKMLLMCLASLFLITVGVLSIVSANGDLITGIFLLSTPFLLIICTRYPAIKKYNESRWTKEKTHFRISNTQISIKTESATSTFDREYITRINERKNVFYFWQSPQSGFPIPMRFLSENQIKFIRLLNLNKPNAEYADSEIALPSVSREN